MKYLQKIKYAENWNIGICSQTPEELLISKKLKPIKWLKHPFRDRWFADPFICKVTESELVVFVEECPMENPKGIICELVIDRKTMCLKDRYIMLRLDTHLSYPSIIRVDGKVYVYPENGASGKLNIYEYDDVNHKLINPVCILDEAVADATIVECRGRYYMCATRYPNTQAGAFLYESDSPFELFNPIGEKCFQEKRSCSRPGGGWITSNDLLYRPAQNCVKRYGSGLSIMHSEIESGNISECLSFSIEPSSFKYNLGLHTLNYLDGILIVDGYGYYYPLLGHLYYSRSLRALLGINKRGK